MNRWSREYQQVFMRVQGYYLGSLSLLMAGLCLLVAEGDWRIYAMGVVLGLAAFLVIVRARNSRR